MGGFLLHAAQGAGRVLARRDQGRNDGGHHDHDEGFHRLPRQLRPVNHHRDVRRAVESHGERVKAYSRQKALDLHAVFQHQQSQAHAQESSHKADDDPLPQEDAHHLERRGAQGLHHGDFLFPLDGNGKHHRHNAEGGNQGDEGQHKAHHHALLLHEFKPRVKAVMPGFQRPRGRGLFLFQRLHHGGQHRFHMVGVVHAQGHGLHHVILITQQFLADDQRNEEVRAGRMLGGPVNADHLQILRHDQLPDLAEAFHVRLIPLPRLEAAQNGFPFLPRAFREGHPAVVHGFPVIQHGKQIHQAGASSSNPTVFSFISDKLEKE